MAVKKGLFKTSVGRKNLMAFTGLFIIFFLVIHLIGNLILVIPNSFFPIEFWNNVANGHDMYNAYSHFLVHFWPVTIVAYILYVAIITHIIDALLITLQNKKSQGEKYIVTDNSTSSWYSRNMGILGTVIGVFLVIHMAQFWLQYKVLKVEHDLYELVLATLKTWWFVLVYEIGIIALGFHLVHGIESAHRSLGIYPKKIMNTIKYIALCFSLVMAILYAIIPIILYFK
ncbi:succinate dehydrogenase cytochrome b subunit [Lutibacter sp.]|uniref:succinate dehydrogenase cytochrome b subunit n=1 Tax=Lutibacter sp. TaxID=1925666 RepID=UPI0025B8C804|nr:succinate dehydrogenase cytochrome b subunit [Lutibacter sp.]MCF6182751.1 succinate dehydrogenase cytochrome b subunit [Lutibacter sp.]